ncbi:MerR family transcriptional regulator [Paracoccus sulfuroxidans]|uniref:DNA-binding transcriptional MerR regulator n=1 Tax=Paracoccus sulfuroxidans TaxID=384678 RepID=A0A562NXV1_9RHOB|nr:MerR family DNA-binding transcriptional regulator [Paracoccus sulfuroxidans]TWI37062.1 DNA-binding transcriptional MerR regulator [Paracoccus sulfuroxidans]
MTDGLMTIREMCDSFNVTPRTLRFYEDRELISPERRGQHRLYNRSDRARLTLILRGKRFGFSLEQIRQILELYDPSERNYRQTQQALATARERLSDMERQYTELGAAIIELRAQILGAEAEIDAEEAVPPASPAQASGMTGDSR